MAERIKIGSINRIEGHLKIEVEVDKGKVINAWSSGTMARGFEILLKGKDPRDAPSVTSRFCGVCFSVHAMTSAKALDDAFGAEVPDGGRLLRNLIMGAEYIYDHIVHFYHLSALDYIDILAVAEYKGNDPELLSVKEKIVNLVNKGDTSPLTPRYEPDAFSVKDPEVVTTLVSHYLKALKIQAEARNMGAIFGGRQPHYQNLVVGGITQLPDAEKIARFKSILSRMIDFVKNTYLSDVLAVGTGPLLPLAQAGLGAGHLNYLSYGAFELDSEGKEKLFKPGVIFDGNFDNIQEFQPEKITESVKYSWYKDTDKPLHPSEGRTEYDLDKKNAYSFVKAPRYDGKPMEVGPLARMLVMQEKTLMSLIKEKKVKPGAVARHAARAIETLLVAEKMIEWLEELALLMDKPNFKIHDTEHWKVPDAAEGAGFYEAPRGALGHWVKIKNKKIENYQAVVPSTWNASPRDEKGVRGQYEEALIGVPVPDPKNPINVVRVIRSFDPCLACAIHLIEPVTNEVLKFKV
jgi:hydrogenase large subunit